ncbi:hypothetical protein UFOVP54_219 [uncultured Caudovirales phage]|uniref:Uncharacterized protein n=1 Tax=uncultured Caudovirales phage TaxID=2100421 RepID=A0A6J5KWP3_9CAUD|nr:hypothetical protein UFOVP54_219 [uncultured Caudovirales phage]
MKKINREELSFLNGAGKKAFRGIVIAVLIAAAAIMMTSCMKEVHMKVTIIDHVVTADKMGNRTYSTIVRAEDGMIQEKTGLGFYVIPKGTEVMTTVYRAKK